MEFTTDTQGNKYFSFEEDDDSYLFEINQIGNKLDDFEILQILTEKKDPNDDSFVAKVRSLNNNKIYSLKKLGVKLNQDLKVKQEIFNFLDKLKKINHPHIIKYYHYFEENNNIFLIMEYMNNSDILGYIQGYQVLNEKIPETEIWNILLQCLSALNFLNYLNYGNSGIKINNIYINNMYNIKIGIFHDYTFNREVYSPNNEIFLLGKYIYVMIFALSFTVKDLEGKKTFIKNLNLHKGDNTNYSSELKNIMITMTKNKQNNDNVSNFYEKVKTEYSKKYTKNTSIKAVLKCLYSFNLLNKKIDESRQIIENDKEKYFMNYWYLKAVDALNGIKENNFTLFIEEFRRALASSFSKLDGNKEIDPLLVLIFLLDKMHKEMNIVDKTFIMENGYNRYNKKKNAIQNYVLNGEQQDKTNKIQMLEEFVNYFNATMKSPISNLFIGFLKTKRNCQNCRSGYYSFSNFLYIVFDLSELDSDQNFDLVRDGFHKNWENPKLIHANAKNKIWCERCQTYQTFKEFNRYYTISNHLIIVFIRGKNYKNRSKIIFEEKINLGKYIEPDNNTPKNFTLVGSVNRKIQNDVEEYIPYYKDPNRENWIKNGFNDIQRNGNEQIILLFYNSKDLTNSGVF